MIIDLFILGLFRGMILVINNYEKVISNNNYVFMKKKKYLILARVLTRGCTLLYFITTYMVPIRWCNGEVSRSGAYDCYYV